MTFCVEIIILSIFINIQLFQSCVRKVVNLESDIQLLTVLASIDQFTRSPREQGQYILNKLVYFCNLSNNSIR